MVDRVLEIAVGVVAAAAAVDERCVVELNLVFALP